MAKHDTILPSVISTKPGAI